jgi:hypothetical protein
MQTAVVSTRRRATPRVRRARLAAGAATVACAAVIGFVVSGGDDATPAKGTEAPVIDARPLPPTPAAERFHHRLDELPGATAGEGRQR